MEDSDKELNEIIYASNNGVGYGGGHDQEIEINRRVQVLMHRQNLEVKRKDTYIAAFNVFLAVVNISLVIYQLFFIK
jgi:hypothetical protein